MKVKNVINHENHKQASLDDYYYNVSRIWSRDYSQRSAIDLWLHIVDHSSRIATAIRKQQPEDVLDDIADTTIWMFSFIAHCNNSVNKIDDFFKLNLTPSEIVWKRYPNICPLCFDSIVISMVESSVFSFKDKTAIVKKLSDDQCENMACSCFIVEGGYGQDIDLKRKERSEINEIRALYSYELAVENRMVINSLLE